LTTSTGRRPDLGLGDSLVSTRFRRVFNDQHRRLVRVVVANAEHAASLISAEQDLVALAPAEHRAPEGRRIGGGKLAFELLQALLGAVACLDGTLDALERLPVCLVALDQ
jgi:hypothetical protein